MAHATTSLDALGSGYGFRKIRPALGIEAFGVNAIVMPPGMEAFWHFHHEQDELYFVHAGTMRVEVGDPDSPESEVLMAGGLFHVTSTTPRRISNAGDDDLTVLVIGAKGGYVGRDGMLVDMDDLARRQSFGSGS